MTEIVPAGQIANGYEFDEDIHPDSDAQPFDGDEHEVNAEVDTVIVPGISTKIVAFMSQTPLLGGSSSVKETTSYGVLRGPAQRSSQRSSRSAYSDSTDRDDEDSSNKGSRSGKNKAIRPAASYASLRSGRRSGESGSYSRSSFQRASLRESSPMLIAEPGHPAGQGGHLGGGLPLTTSEDEEDDEEQAISSDADDDELDPADNSLYAQVRASVAATDNTMASINTPRMWILSLLCALLGSATNLFFSLRYPSVAITPVIALVTVHPLGRLWDQVLKYDDDPTETFEDGDRVKLTKPQGSLPTRPLKARLRLWLAQGHWNGKEHACVYISSNVSFGFAFATDVIVEQSKFYHQNPSIIYQLLLTISTQILGYSFAGLTRRYLVRPPSMIWPGTLMSTAMFTTMHSSENKSANGWMISRWRFFLYTWSAAFAWYFLPGLLMPALSYFSVITWFAPKNVVVANLVRYRSERPKKSASRLTSSSSAFRLGWGSFQ